MIRVPQPVAPQRLAQLGLDEATKHTEKLRGKRGDLTAILKTFKFKAYGIPEVRVALEQAFNKKCAYCEIRYEGAMVLRVEHYRPKGRIDIEGAKPIGGYYWLAADWRNLLPSCERCNIVKKDYIPSRDVREKVGKGNRFPLWDEKRRARRTGEEAREFPLLLHPYFDQPERFLEFTQAGTVLPAKALRGRNKKKAETSISIYGLDRLGLVKERDEHGKRVLAQFKLVMEAYDDWQSMRRVHFRDRMLRNWDELDRLLGKDQEFSLASNQLVAAASKSAEYRTKYAAALRARKQYSPKR